METFVRERGRRPQFHSGVQVLSNKGSSENVEDHMTSILLGTEYPETRVFRNNNLKFGLANQVRRSTSEYHLYLLVLISKIETLYYLVTLHLVLVHFEQRRPQE